MYKRNLMVIISSILAIFLISGCVQEPIETKDTVEQKESSDEETVIEKKEDKSKSSDTTNVDLTKEEISNLSELRVHYIDVGQADSTLIQFNDAGEEYTILIDAGNWNKTNVISYLQSQNVSQIDIAIGTHPDADHIGQMDKVINKFNVGEIWLSGNTSTSKTFQRLLHAIDSKAVDYYEPRMGDKFEIGPLDIEVLYPKTISENDNEESISIKVTYGEVRFIFTGDASKKNELNMIQSGVDLKADILHLGHHGSSTSTDPSFLKEVNPSTAIYSAGLNNNYGHPHAEVVNLIQNAGIKLYGTDVHGTVIVTTDGNGYNVLTKKDGTITPTNNEKITNEKQELNEESPKLNNGCVNINSASIEELQNIIHIGPARAEDLIKLRPFQSVDDLSRIDGIGPSRINGIKSQGIACIGG